MLASLAVREGHWERRQARPIANLASKLRDCKSGDGPCRGAKKPGHAPELGLRPGATATAKWHRMYKSGALPDFLVEAWEAVQTMPNGSTFAGPSRGRFRGGEGPSVASPAAPPTSQRTDTPPDNMAREVSQDEVQAVLGQPVGGRRRELPERLLRRPPDGLHINEAHHLPGAPLPRAYNPHWLPRPHFSRTK